MEAFQITLIIALVLAAAELLTGSFIMLGLALGGCAVAITQWLGGGMSINRDLLVFAVASLLAFVACRRIFRKTQDQQDAANDVNRY